MLSSAVGTTDPTLHIHGTNRNVYYEVALEPETDPRVKAVFDDIRATRKTDFINNFWRALAFDPTLLEQTWAEVKRLMATPSNLIR